MVIVDQKENKMPENTTTTTVEPTQDVVYEVKRADLEKFNVKTVEELQYKIKNGLATAETLVNMADGLHEAVTQLTAATQALVQQKTLETNEEQFKAAAATKLKSIYDSLPDNDPQKLAIMNEMGKNFGVRNAELVLEGSEIEKALHMPLTEQNPDYSDLKDFRKAMDYTLILGAVNGGFQNSKERSDTLIPDASVLGRAAATLAKQGQPGAEVVQKAFETALADGTAGAGLEWIPTYLSATMVEDVWLQLIVASLFPRYTMPSPTFNLPIRTARGRAYRMPEATGHTQFFNILATDQTFTTNKVTFVAQKLATLQFISDELEQDSILPIIQMLYEEAVYGMADAIEDTIINGDSDTTTGHMDSTLWSGTSDARGAWDGLRKNLVNSSLLNNTTGVDGSTFNLDTMRNTRKLLGKYGATNLFLNGQGLAWIVSPQTHVEILKFPEVLTMYAFGQNATVITGQIGQIDGIPIVISPRIPTNLNASGVYDAATTTKTCALLVNRRTFAFGDRKTVRVESDRNPLSGQRYVLSTLRSDFKKLFLGTEPTVAWLYDLAL